MCLHAGAQRDTLTRAVDSTSQQADSLRKVVIASQQKALNGFLTTRRGLFGKWTKKLIRDTAAARAGRELQRVDLRFKPFTGFVIRKIDVVGVDFGTPFNNFSLKKKNILTKTANGLHINTKTSTVFNNLFFDYNDTLNPYLIADNERFLRNIPYFQDAKIVVERYKKTDSVNITVITKDVLSFGPSVSAISTKRTEWVLKEDNFLGTGDRIAIKALFDIERTTKFGYGLEYIKRNIGGSFIDGYAGYSNFNNSINGFRQESSVYLKLIKPLVNQYTKFTYAFEAANHRSSNLYSKLYGPDSLFNEEWRYKYYNIDAWVGYNINLQKLSSKNEGGRLRGLVGIRVIQQHFNEKPIKYIEQYNPAFPNMAAILSSFTVFKQNIYKTRYIYGFGRTEDVPQGTDVTMTVGWSRKQQTNRPYLGLSFERSYFNDKENYFDFIVRADGYPKSGHVEDINLLASVNYFTDLHDLNADWKQRSFMSASITQQFNSVFNVPMQIESQFGLQEFYNGYVFGKFRANWRGESVFFSPWSLAGFRFAPFTFYNACYFVAQHQSFVKGELYSAIGGGIRTRNDNLTLGTLELKAYYLPRANYFNKHFRIEVSTNLRFRYNSEIVRRPGFVEVN